MQVILLFSSAKSRIRKRTKSYDIFCNLHEFIELLREVKQMPKPSIGKAKGHIFFKHFLPTYVKMTA